MSLRVSSVGSLTRESDGVGWNKSDCNSLYLIERNLILLPVVEFDPPQERSQISPNLKKSCGTQLSSPITGNPADHDARFRLEIARTRDLLDQLLGPRLAYRN